MRSIAPLISYSASKSLMYSAAVAEQMRRRSTSTTSPKSWNPAPKTPTMEQLEASRNAVLITPQSWHKPWLTSARWDQMRISEERHHLEMCEADRLDRRILQSIENSSVPWPGASSTSLTSRVRVLSPRKVESMVWTMITNLRPTKPHKRQASSWSSWSSGNHTSAFDWVSMWTTHTPISTVSNGNPKGKITPRDY